jgi:hypothetical protein
MHSKLQILLFSRQLFFRHVSKILGTCKRQQLWFAVARSRQYRKSTTGTWASKMYTRVSGGMGTSPCLAGQGVTEEGYDIVRAGWPTVSSFSSDHTQQCASRYLQDVTKTFRNMLQKPLWRSIVSQLFLEKVKVWPVATILSATDKGLAGSFCRFI